MYKTIQDITKKSFAEYQNIPRTEWVRKWPSMVILTVSQIMWTSGVDAAIKNTKLKEYEEVLSKDILGVVMLVRQKLESLTRKTLSALITIDVHARDIVTDLKNKRVNNINQFD